MKKRLHFYILTEKMINNRTNIFKNCILLIIFAWIIGLIGLLFAYFIPSNQVKTDTAIEIFKNEGPGPILLRDHLSTRLDNYTDSIMINTASYEGDESFINQVLLNFHNEMSGETPFESFINTSSTLPQISVNYARYWHGYLPVIKPLLCIFDYSYLRIINYILQLTLVILISVKMLLCKLNQYIIPFWGMYATLSPIALGKSLQYSTMFYVISFVILIILCSKSRVNEAKTIYFMIIVGCITSYFDFLTYPIVSMCVSLVFLELISENSKKTYYESFKMIIISSVSWSIGYVGMWAGKWILASWFTDYNVIKDAILSGIYRMSSDVYDSGFYEKITPFTSLQKNIMVLVSPLYFFLGLLLIILIVIQSKFSINNSNKNTLKNRLFSFGLIGFIPILWLLIMCNHSYVHSWMTYRNLSSSVLAWGCAFIELLNYRMKKESKQNVNY